MTRTLAKAVLFRVQVWALVLYLLATVWIYVQAKWDIWKYSYFGEYLFQGAFLALVVSVDGLLLFSPLVVCFCRGRRVHGLIVFLLFIMWHFAIQALPPVTYENRPYW